MRRAVEGRFKVVFLATTLPLLKVVTVTLATGVFLTAGFVAFAVVEVLRVRLLRGVVAFVGFAAVDLTGIGFRSDVYFYNIAIKNPLWGV
tara:strand:- start:1042 stop:1311 length:270 start_codon:yes stop_codon:yes gene_type:complete